MPGIGYIHEMQTLLCHYNIHRIVMEHVTKYQKITWIFKKKSPGKLPSSQDRNL